MTMPFGVTWNVRECIRGLVQSLYLPFSRHTSNINS
jgi:hypothetical protein